MRLFLCVRPPAAARTHLLRALRDRPTTDPLRWHVTLVFLGDVADPAPLLPGLSATTAGFPPLALRLAGGGFFSGPGAYWAGLAGDLDGLHALARSLTAACRGAGVAVEDRSFTPHLTVARRLRSDPGVLSDYRGTPWTAAKVELVRSRLGPGVKHEVLHRFALRGQASSAGSAVQR